MSEIFHKEKTILITERLDGSLDVFTLGLDGRKHAYGPLPKGNEKFFLFIVAAAPLGGERLLFALDNNTNTLSICGQSSPKWVPINPPDKEGITMVSATAMPYGKSAVALFVITRKRNIYSAILTNPGEKVTWSSALLFDETMGTAAILAGQLTGDGFAAVAVKNNKGSVWWNLKHADNSIGWTGWRQTPQQNGFTPAWLRLEQHGMSYRDGLRAFSLLGWNTAGQRYASQLIKTRYWQTSDSHNKAWAGDFAINVESADSLTIFAVDAGKALYAAQLGSTNGWSEWRSCGRDDCNGNGSLDIIHISSKSYIGVVASGLFLFKSADLDKNEQWEHFSGIKDLRGPVCMQLNQDGRLEVYVISNDGALYAVVQKPDKGWREWFKKMEPPDKACTVTSALTKDGRIVLFLVTENGNVWYAWQTTANAGWHDKIDFGKLDPCSPLSLTNWPDGRKALFGLKNAKLHFRKQPALNSEWDAWEPLPSLSSKHLSLSAVCNANGILELFTVSGDGKLWNIREKSCARGNFDRPFLLGTSFNGPIKALNILGSIHLFGITVDGKMVHARYDNMNPPESTSWEKLS